MQASRAAIRLQLLMGSLILSTGLGTAVLAAEPNLSSPAPGVLCDAAGPVCYDAQGPSIGHTQTYFGRTAATQLTQQLSGRPPVQEFRLSNGSVCDTRASLCWSDGYNRRTVAPQLSQQLFGSSTNSSSSTGLQFPQSGVVCDSAGKLCYDRMGLSLGLTREYFGTYAEQQALRQLNGQAPPRVFRLGNGSVCDVDARRCWSDGWERRSPNPSLSRQLFGQEAGDTARLAQCRLTRWFKVLNSGSCEIGEGLGERGRTLTITLSDGAVISFSNPRGLGYQLSDSKGNTWPVRVIDQGSSINFSWSDRVLQVTPQRQQGAWAPSLGQLLDSLLSK